MVKYTNQKRKPINVLIDECNDTSFVLEDLHTYAAITGVKLIVSVSGTRTNL